MAGPPETARDFVSLVRENIRTHGDTRSFTFISEEPGRRYKENVLGFADLDRRARALGCRLEARGLRDRAVLLLYPEGLEFLAAFLGCLYARVIAVPAPLPDLDAGRFGRTRRIIEDADVALILTDTAHRDTLDAWLSAAGLKGRVHCLDTQAGKDTDAGDWSPPRSGPDTVAFLQYTSGSTSEPKGVMVTHGNLVANGEEIKRRIEGSPATVGVGWVPHYHDMGLVGQFLQPLYLGCRYVFTSPITFIKRPVLWLELITRYRGTITVAPNFGYELVLRRVTDRQLEGLDLSSLTVVKNGAEPVRAATLEAVAERLAPVGFRPSMWMPCYGMAETTLLITGAPLGGGPVVRDFDAGALARNEAVPADEPGLTGGDPAAGGARRLVSSGRPVTLDVRVVDPETRAERPERRVGEIWVRGGSVARGYWGSPEQTEATFRARTSAGEGPFLRTGDLGFTADGELYVTGRIKDLIIVNGRNIHAHDIEEVARASHPAALLGAAFAIDAAIDPDLGPAPPGGRPGGGGALDASREQVVIVQEISTRAAAGTPLEEVASAVRTRVARTFELPAVSVVLAARGSVRRTTSGKMQRRLTREAFLTGKITELAADLEPGVAGLRRAPAPIDADQS
ncbi:acyl-CoA synthetase (AMP-forming)/AMP-acid ligase II [Actinomadura coerulea]|uniref:Acyl-CoA synthetase (AMP-forming)/AMP-acid ligase II n=1 Tax=Actinomadura coerulea TaxID=46159 RepID=A0A7X0G5W4_9ACTN|nr:fatty acyl-AMP ligase [Actinomadura coerulea]MBB6399988.1 acyl-CoA synthetase (AMP-forming)/AMP-acid ligase II [Actinomadura coerulea]GGQ17441.1 polyketide synthase [Actinomadura coerulea]